MSTPEMPPGGPWGEPEPWQAWAQPVEKPQSIRTAVLLMYVGAGLTALNVVVSFLQRDELRDQLRESNDSLTANQVDALTNVFLIFGVVFGLAAIGLWLWMAASNGRGRSWARVVASVLGGLYIASALINLAMEQVTSLGVVVVIAGLLLVVAILVLLYRPDSSRYYEAQSQR